MNRRRYRTPRWVISTRLIVTAATSIYLFGWFFDNPPGLYFMSVCVITGYVYMWLMSQVIWIIGQAMYAGDPEYEKWLDSGADPYYDFIPWPWNTDSYAVTAGGRPEPDTAFVPPDNWIYQCPKCGARNESEYSTCWHCGFVPQDE